MIICSCNVLSDDDVRGAAASVRQQTCTPGQIFGCLGCTAQCGRCAGTIKRIVSDALSVCRAPAGSPSPATNLEPGFYHIVAVHLRRMAVLPCATDQSKVEPTAAIGVNPSGCIAMHTSAARERGATREEIAEVLGVAISVNAGAAVVYSTRAIDAFEAAAEINRNT
jgi:bacterioferritin-associated ferredoxin